MQLLSFLLVNKPQLPHATCNSNVAHPTLSHSISICSVCGLLCRVLIVVRQFFKCFATQTTNAMPPGQTDSRMSQLVAFVSISMAVCVSVSASFARRICSCICSCVGAIGCIARKFVKDVGNNLPAFRCATHTYTNTHKQA